MSFNSHPSKQAQVVIFTHKSKKPKDPTIAFNNNSVQNSPHPSTNAKASAQAYLCFLVSALAKKMPRQLNS